MSSSASGVDLAAVLKRINDKVSKANMEDFDFSRPRERVELEFELDSTGGGGDGDAPAAHVSEETAGKTGRAVVSSSRSADGDLAGASVTTSSDDGGGQAASLRGRKPTGSLADTLRAVHRLLKRHTEMRKQIRVLEDTVNRRNEQLQTRLSFRSFAVKDVALFLPIRTPEGKHTYLAFNERRPHRYLSDDTVRSLRYRGRYPDYVLGRILMIEKHHASQEFNPYHLRLQTKFYILTVERVFGRSASDGHSSAGDAE